MTTLINYVSVSLYKWSTNSLLFIIKRLDFALGSQKHYSFVHDSAFVHENIFSTRLNS